jgi:hypothetical protein
LQEDYDLSFLFIGQTKITERPIDVLRDLGLGPAINFLSSSCRAVSGLYGVCVLIARVIEMDQLFQAFDVTIVKERLLK